MQAKFVIAVLACALGAACGLAHAQAFPLKRIPWIERPVVFLEPTADRDWPIAGGVRYEEFVAGLKPDKVRIYKQAKFDEFIAFFGPLTSSGKEYPRESRDRYISSDDAQPAAGWPLRYIVTVYDTYERPATLQDPDNGEIRPYKPHVRVDTRRFDQTGRELQFESGAPTGRRVHKLGKGFHYLGSESTPRKLVNIFQWQLCQQTSGKPLIPCYSPANPVNGDPIYPRPYRVADHSVGRFANVVEAGRQNQADLAQLNNYWAYHDDPVLPLMISDFEMSKEGKVLKGRAMCMADCPPGYLFKLLKAGDRLPLSKP
jgi:hypothetical protein